MTSEGWITLGVVGAMVVAMTLNLAGPDLVLVAGLTLLLAFGVIGPEEAFSGFANPAVVTIAALLIVAAGVRETGLLDYLGRRLLGTPRALAGAQMRVMFPVGALSAFYPDSLDPRDARQVERKKPGRPKARKRFQFSKR